MYIFTNIKLSCFQCPSVLRQTNHCFATFCSSIAGLSKKKKPFLQFLTEYQILWQVRLAIVISLKRILYLSYFMFCWSWLICVCEVYFHSLWLLVELNNAVFWLYYLHKHIIIYPTWTHLSIPTGKTYDAKYMFYLSGKLLLALK